jgi:hypothetical protein
MTSKKTTNVTASRPPCGYPGASSPPRPPKALAGRRSTAPGAATPARVRPERHGRVNQGGSARALPPEMIDVTNKNLRDKIAQRMAETGESRAEARRKLQENRSPKPSNAKVYVVYTFTRTGSRVRCYGLGQCTEW